MNRSRIGVTISVVYALFFFCLHYFSTSVSADLGGRREEHPFITACRTGDTDRVKTFIEQEGFDINAVLSGGHFLPGGRFLPGIIYWSRTGLYAAVLGNQLHVVEQLLAASADVNKRVENFSPLWVAARKNFVECAEVLIRYGAEFNQDDGRPPLYIASLNGYYGMVRLLLENGANPQLKDRRWEVSETSLRAARRQRLYYLHRWRDYTKTIGLLTAYSRPQPQPADETTPLLLGTSSHSGTGKL